MPKSSWKRADPDNPLGAASAATVPIASLVGTVPVVEETCVAAVLEPVKWTLLEHWAARCILEVGGFTGAEDLAEFLGLHARFVQPALTTLAEHGLIDQASGQIAPKPALAEAMQKGTHRKAVEKRFRCLRDPVTNRRWSAADGDGQRLQPDAKAPKPDVPDPRELRKWAAADSGPLAGLDVVDVKVTAVKAGRLPVEIRVFVDHMDSQWGWDVYEHGTENRRQDLRRACEAEDIHDVCREIVQQHVITDPEEPTPPPRKEEYVPLHQQASSPRDIEYLEARSAQNRVLELIKQAKEEIVMFFPWIKSAGLRHLEGHLRAALDRGVAILIGYGIADRPEDEQSHVEVVSRLASMKSSKGHAVVVVRWLGSSHTKEMVIDRKHYLHGSHNMLSFIGGERDPHKGVRRELMSVDSNRERFWPALRELRGYFMTRQAPPKGGTRPDTLQAWLTRWQDALHLGFGPVAVVAALAECPQGDLAAITASRLVLLGLQHQEPGPADECIVALAGWLTERTGTRARPAWITQALQNAIASSCLHQAHLREFRARLQDSETQ
jgi:hypothetical protein